MPAWCLYRWIVKWEKWIAGLCYGMLRHWAGVKPIMAMLLTNKETILMRGDIGFVGAAYLSWQSQFTEDCVMENGQHLQSQYYYYRFKHKEAKSRKRKLLLEWIQPKNFYWKTTLVKGGGEKAVFLVAGWCDGSCQKCCRWATDNRERWTVVILRKKGLCAGGYNCCFRLALWSLGKVSLLVSLLQLP